MVLQQIEAIRALKLHAAEAEAKSAQMEREVAHARLSAKNAEPNATRTSADSTRRRRRTTTSGGVAAAGDESGVAQQTAVAQSTIASPGARGGEEPGADARADSHVGSARA